MRASVKRVLECGGMSGGKKELYGRECESGGEEIAKEEREGKVSRQLEEDSIISSSAGSSSSSVSGSRSKNSSSSSSRGNGSSIGDADGEII